MNVMNAAPSLPTALSAFYAPLSKACRRQANSLVQLVLIAFTHDRVANSSYWSDSEVTDRVRTEFLISSTPRSAAPSISGRTKNERLLQITVEFDALKHLGRAPWTRRNLCDFRRIWKFGHHS